MSLNSNINFPRIWIFLFALSSMVDASHKSDFRDTLSLDYRTKEHLDKYWLPSDHPFKGCMDTLFAQPGVTESVESLIEAGFHIMAARLRHPVIAKHPLVEGYIFKIYPDSMQYTREGIASAEWLLRRCMIADKIRKIIRTKGIAHFVVPDKWLYRLPFAKKHCLLLVATDMEVEDATASAIAWKTKITPRHLDELYAILTKGYGSDALPINIPYTKKGYFTFIDTEQLKRDLDMNKVKKHLSKDMRRYWQKLIDRS